MISSTPAASYRPRWTLIRSATIVRLRSWTAFMSVLIAPVFNPNAAARDANDLTFAL